MMLSFEELEELIAQGITAFDKCDDMTDVDHCCDNVTDVQEAEIL